MQTLFRAHGVQFNYHHEADRISLLLFDANECHCVWLTRRYLLQLVPQVAQWMGHTAKIGSKEASTEAVKMALSEFEHAAAKSNVKTAKESGVAVPGRPQSISREYLSTLLQLQPRKDKVLIQFGMAKRFESEVLLSRGELHKLLGCLLDLANKSGWEIVNPWQEIALVAH